MQPEELQEGHRVLTDRLKATAGGWEGSDLPADQWLREHGLDLLAAAEERNELQEKLDACISSFLVANVDLRKERDALSEAYSQALESLRLAETHSDAFAAQAKKAETERDALLVLVEELHDTDPCSYDHHDYCQAHSLHDRPCPHGRAQELFK
jgi:hypothetical protein